MAEDKDKETWSTAKNLLLGAVDVVLKLGEAKSGSSSSTVASTSSANIGREIGTSSGERGQGHKRSCLTLDEGDRKRRAHTEQRRLFASYQPPKVPYGGHTTVKGKGKKGKGRKTGPTTWTKEVVYLRSCTQESTPTTEEKIELARLNLGLKKVTFEAEGSAAHVHDTIVANCSILDNCGGYTLLRTADNSRDLVEIDVGGVPILKDILRQAKLYVRPLQCDIPEDKLREWNEEARELSEPRDYCRKCNIYFSLSELRKHVAEGDCDIQSDAKRPKRVHDPPENAHSYDAEQPWQDSSLTDSPYLYIRDSPSSVVEGGTKELESVTGGSATYSCYIDLLSEPDAEWENDPAVQEMLHSSVVSCQALTGGETPLKVEEILEKHRSEVLDKDVDNVFRVTVRRSNIWEDTLRALKRKFSDQKHIRVTFLGESGVDGGGPRREFFMLLMNALQEKSILLDGPLDQRILRHNTAALQQEVYLYMGKLIALSVIHGGPGPKFFASPVVDYLFGGLSAVHARRVDIPDPEIQEHLQQMLAVTTDVELRKLATSPSFRFLNECGITKPPSTFKLVDREQICSAVCLHYTVLSSLAELGQLRRGLNTAGFSSLMETYPELLRPLFLHSTVSIKASTIQDMFMVNYSQPGSNRRSQEETIMMNWISYLQDLEESSDHSPSLKDVFIFLTGCSEVPPLGFPGTEPEIVFSDSTTLPKVSTCALRLTMLYSLPNESVAFQERMDYAILNSQGFFGQV